MKKQKQGGFIMGTSFQGGAYIAVAEGTTDITIIRGRETFHLTI